MTLLVAGSNPNELETPVHRLQKEGFRIISTFRQESTLALARSEAPNLILLDFDPCFDACRMLKRNFVTESIPIIALLSRAEEQDRIAVLELGADDCVAKPYNFRELMLRIRASLNRTRDKAGMARHRKAQYYSALTGASGAI